MTATSTVEGVYAASFLSNLNQYGQGIIVLDGGRIHGGDLDYAYTGKYSFTDNDIVATVDVANYSGGFTSVMRDLPHYRLTLNGRIKAHEMTVSGEVEGRPDLKIQINLRKISPLVGS